MSIINWELASKLKPTAHITVNKSRLKAYGSTVYLQDGSNFEVELYNPSNQTHLAKIKINGSYISQAGIIIKPGERVFLERFIDIQKKFKFETYHVDGDSAEVLTAIAQNGEVIIEFYPQKLATSINPYRWYTGDSGSSNTFTVYNDANINFTTTNGTGYYTNTSFGGTTVNNISMNVAGSLETGRVEVGESSNQQLVETFGEFSNYIETQVVWKINPVSQKPIQVGEIRQYCTNCQTRIKKASWKFCPTCGENLKD